MSQAAAIELDPRDVLNADAESPEPMIPTRLLRFCRTRTRDVQSARDLMADAIAVTLAGEGWHRWKYDGKRTPAESLLIHLFNMAKDVHKKELESAAAWREVQGDPEHDPPAPDSAPRPGEKPAKWTKQDDEMRLAALVMERLDEDAREMLRVESESDEELDGETLARKLGWTSKQVYRARERVVYHRDAVLAAERKKGGRA
jgi:DNA-directed RNA polymerase specialized sigma24 family protein